MHKAPVGLARAQLEHLLLCQLEKAVCAALLAHGQAMHLPGDLCELAQRRLALDNAGIGVGVGRGGGVLHQLHQICPAAGLVIDAAVFQLVQENDRVDLPAEGEHLPHGL